MSNPRDMTHYPTTNHRGFMVLLGRNGWTAYTLKGIPLGITRRKLAQAEHLAREAVKR